MYKSAVVHLMNKFPSAKVISDDNSVDVFSTDGEHLVAIRRDGNGCWNCAQKDTGATFPFSLAPIPKHARFRKLFSDGRIGDAEEAKSRQGNAVAYERNSGYVPSILELAGGDQDIAKSQKFQEALTDGQPAVVSRKAQPTVPQKTQTES